jgi:leucyl aminopeptidase
MEFVPITSLERRKKAEALVIPYWKTKKGIEAAVPLGALSQLVELPLKTDDFTAKEGELLFIYVQRQEEPRFVLLGLGDKEKLTTERLRRAYASFVKGCMVKKIKEVNVLYPENSSLSPELSLRGVLEGMLLANYRFDFLKRDALKECPSVILEKASFITTYKDFASLAKETSTICDGVYLARNLVNGNADDVTPQFLVKQAELMAKKNSRLKVTAFNKKRIEKEKMGLLLAVNRGSVREPAFIIIEYKGNPKSSDRTVIVGKGVTYDTGGLNLKPTGSMETMKCDMAGAAACLGTMQAVAALGLKVNVTAVIPSTENAISDTSYKPGDVYVGYAGKSVEIGNTDAEGRLILADALAYACKNLKPTRIIDLATLTGSIGIALGDEATGLMSNDDILADSLIRAGSETFERVWRLPIFEEYRELLRSQIADISNIGGRGAGASTGAVFLQEFVGKTPWAHLDIASTGNLKEALRYHPKSGTGIGVRLLVELLQHLE